MSSVELPQLRVRVLGGLAVEGMDEHEIGSRKGRMVLKVLALGRGAPVTTDRLADVLWGNEPPSRPVDQVGVLVSRLRAALGSDRVPRTDAGYALRYDWLDIEELEARVAEADRRHSAGQAPAARAAAEAALALVRGPLLPDEDGEWIDVERAVADGMARRARLVLAEAAAHAGDHGVAVVAAEALLASDPYDEAALRALMRAHAAAGRPASALATYAEMRTRLVEDLGVSPSAATEALHEAILLVEDTPASPAPRPPRSGLVGRDREVAMVAAALDEAAIGRTAFVVVEGEPGIGKTALLEAACVTAIQRGFAVVRGRADVLGHDLPLQPVLDGLTAALRALEPEAAAAVLGADAPVLDALLGSAASTGTSEATVLTDPAAGRLMLFTALLATYERLASGRPLLLAIDDLHTADSATLEWLPFAARRGRRLAVLAARRPGQKAPEAPARLITLGPLELAAVAEMVGPDRAPDLHDRSGGNPLFLLELAQTTESLPAGIRQAAIERADALGTYASQTLRTAAVLGPVIDLDLLAAVLGCPLSTLLDHADEATTSGLLVEQGSTYGFKHDLLREALADSVTAARRAFLHRQAARELAGRVGADARLVAWHARQGGDASLAADSLVAVAEQAAARYDHHEAERVLSEAVALADGANVRLARARLRTSRWDLIAAAEDAEQAIALGAGAAAFETAGWVAYYRRDFDGAQRYADEGAARATDTALVASCLALGGRTRHSRGELHEAEPRLVDAAQCELAEVRGVAQVWLAGLRAHQGKSAEALELSERALLEPGRFGHPFAVFHGQFFHALSLGMQGRLEDLRRSADRVEEHALRAGEQGERFVPVAINLRAWSLRAAGRSGEAIDQLHHALDLCDPKSLPTAEPRHMAMLDIVDALIDAGGLDRSRKELTNVEISLRDWNGTMAWRARHRSRLLDARLRLAEGDFATAEQVALAVAGDCAKQGNRRHELLALCVATEAIARAGGTVEVEAVDQVLARLDACAGLESWRITARLAVACQVDRWWGQAERRAARFVSLAGPMTDHASRYVNRTFAVLRQAG